MVFKVTGRCPFCLVAFRRANGGVLTSQSKVMALGGFTTAGGFQLGGDSLLDDRHLV
jgi:hypothetical protein